MTKKTTTLSCAVALIAAVAAGAAVLLLSATSDAAPQPPKVDKARPRVMLVGWDGGDWELLDPLMKEGRLPNLSALVAKGRTWELESYQPAASPLLWTTFATGRSPVDHGVCDFQELEPGSRRRLPISGRARKFPAIWNAASARGVSVGVVGWWATWPAEKVNGFLVSDRASPVLFDFDALSKSKALTWPDGLGDGVRILVKREGSPGYDDVRKALQITPGEFDAAVAARQDLAHPITGYQKILGSTRVTASVALQLYDKQKPELMMVYFQGTDEIGHVLGRFHPPKLATISDEDFRRYSGAVVAFYVEADRILGQLMTRAERDGATLILLSDHGFKWKEDRPGFYSGTQFDTAFLWHRRSGMLAAAGPAVAASSSRGKATVFDVTPTLCKLLKLPADPSWEGKPIAGFAGPAAPQAVAWAKAFPVERLVVSEKEDPKTAEEFTKKLISLGYLTGAEAAAVDARPPERAGTETAGHFGNIATFLCDRGKFEESLSWYRKALEVNPKSAVVWMNLSTALHQVGPARWAESDELLLKACVLGYNDPEAAIYRRVATYMRQSGREPKARPQLVAFLRRAQVAYPQNPKLRSSLGKALFESAQLGQGGSAEACGEAQKIFRQLTEQAPRDFESWNLLALTSLCLDQPANAREAFEKSLAVNPDQEAVRESLREMGGGRR